MKKLITIPDAEIFRLKQEAFNVGMTFSAYCTKKILGNPNPQPISEPIEDIPKPTPERTHAVNCPCSACKP